MESYRQTLIDWFQAEYPEREREWREFLRTVPEHEKDLSSVIARYERNFIPGSIAHSTTFRMVKTRCGG